MEFGLIAATAADWPIVGQIAWVFGKLMDDIYISEFIWNSEYRNMYYSVYNYYLYIDDPADDQTAEIFKNAVCDDAGNSKTAEKNMQEKEIRHPCSRCRKSSS